MMANPPERTDYTARDAVCTFIALLVGVVVMAAMCWFYPDWFFQ